ncbi:hypothetical protein D3C86_955430 [compost metagenome]
MNKFSTLLIILVFPVFIFGQTNTDSLLNDLDQTVTDYQIYLNRKETSINKLKGLLKYTTGDLQKYEVYGKLYDEYKAYQLDSALVYARKSLQISHKLKNSDKINEAKLNVASIMGTLGMYKESIDVLETIDTKLSPTIRGNYYGTYRVVYG